MEQTEFAAVLARLAAYTADHRARAGSRPQRPEITYAEALSRFSAATPERGAALDAVVTELIECAEPGLAAMIGPRFFGWVIGATEPAGMAADWLTSAWGQNTGNAAATPSASAAEEVSAGWLLDLLDLPRDASVGFCTGATMASFTCLAAARGEVLRRAGWNADADGLFGAPPIEIVLGEDAHSTIFSALKYLGLGYARVTRVPVDAQGRMRADAFAAAMQAAQGKPLIAIAQAGHIHSGAFDPFDEIAAAARAAGAWLHVDGAFGLWARAAPDRASLTQGIERADSWSVDGHKWLQTPHDNAFAIVRDRNAHYEAMKIAASYLPSSGDRHPSDYVPELSRRGRGFATWAMIKSLGRVGIAAMVSRHCALARRMAERLATEPGVQVLNDVVLNQVAVKFGADLEPSRADVLTQRMIARVQQGGECFIGGAAWRGAEIVRVSVISAPTTEADIDRAADAILSAWRAEAGANS